MERLGHAKTPDGIKIRLEDWSGHNTEKLPGLYGLVIVAHPIAKHDSKDGRIKTGDTFRLQIPHSEGYSNDNVREDYEALKSGTKTLEDLAPHFWNGDEVKLCLGIE